MVGYRPARSSRLFLCIHSIDIGRYSLTGLRIHVKELKSGASQIGVPVAVIVDHARPGG
jgi:hypothetical protein